MAAAGLSPRERHSPLSTLSPWAGRQHDKALGATLRNKLEWIYLPALVRGPVVWVVFSDVRVNSIEGELFIRSHCNCLYN